MVSAINSALSGLNAASQQLESSARRIAGQGASKQADASSPNQNTNQNTSLTPGLDDHLDHDLVNQNVASYDFKANLKTIKTADEMQQSLLNIIG